MKCWNCGVEIVRSENWTPTNKIWFENPDGNCKVHDFKKCFREKMVKEGKWEHQKSEETLINEPDPLYDKPIKFWNFEVHCYYCNYHTKIQNSYEAHVLAKHYSKQPVFWKIDIGGKIHSVKSMTCNPCYPGLVDLKLLGLTPKGYYWEV